MTLDDHGHFEESVAAYLLGALPGDEAAEFEEHMGGCERCRLDYQRLRVGAEALPRSVEPVSAPASLRESLMSTVRAEARERASPTGTPARRKGALARLRERLFQAPPALAWVSAAFVLLIGAAAGWGVSELASGGGNGTRVVAAAVDRSRLPAGSATLRVAHDKRGATLLVHGLPSPGRGRVYEVWVQHGKRFTPAGSLFDVGPDGNGSAAIPGDLSGADAVLVTRERRGGTAQPTEMPVVTARLS